MWVTIHVPVSTELMFLSLPFSVVETGWKPAEGEQRSQRQIELENDPDKLTSVLKQILYQVKVRVK